MPFLDSKYTNWYDTIVVRAQNRALSPDEYYEKHHIIPKSLGGSNQKENMVKLTAREQFSYYWLLTAKTIGGAANFERWHGNNCKLIGEVICLG